MGLKVVYQDIEWLAFSGPTILKLQKFTGIIYGGKTDNFKKHRKLLRR